MDKFATRNRRSAFWGLGVMVGVVLCVLLNLGGDRSEPTPLETLKDRNSDVQMILSGNF